MSRPASSSQSRSRSSSSSKELQSADDPTEATTHVSASSEPDIDAEESSNDLSSVHSLDPAEISSPSSDEPEEKQLQRKALVTKSQFPVNYSLFIDDDDDDDDGIAVASDDSSSKSSSVDGSSADDTLRKPQRDPSRGPVAKIKRSEKQIHGKSGLGDRSGKKGKPDKEKRKRRRKRIADSNQNSTNTTESSVSMRKTTMKSGSKSGSQGSHELSRPIPHLHSYAHSAAQEVSRPAMTRSAGSRFDLRLSVNAATAAHPGRHRRHLHDREEHGFFGVLRDTVAEAFPPIMGTKTVSFENLADLDPDSEDSSDDLDKRKLTVEDVIMDGDDEGTRSDVKPSRRIKALALSPRASVSKLPTVGQRAARGDESDGGFRRRRHRDRRSNTDDSTRSLTSTTTRTQSTRLFSTGFSDTRTMQDLIDIGLRDTVAIDLELHGLEHAERHLEVLHHEEEMDEEIERKLQFAMENAPSLHHAQLAGELRADILPRREMSELLAFGTHINEVQRLKSIIKSTGVVLLDLAGWDAEEFADQLLDELVLHQILDKGYVDIALQSIADAEIQFPRAIGNAYDVLFGTVPSLMKEGVGISVSFARLKHPVNMDAPDAIPTRFVFLVLVSGEHSTAHNILDICEAIHFLMCEEEFHDEAITMETKTKFFKSIDSFVDRVTQAGFNQVHHLGEHIPDSAAKENLTTRWTGKIGRGVWLDIQSRYVYYLSDIKDALNMKCVAAIFFLFFACLGPAIAFGGVMATLTGNSIGPIEMILATSVVSTTYALFSAQPLMILGGTGPLLVFTGVLYDLSLSLEIDFLPMYAWVGLWSMLFCVIAAFTEASVLIHYCTRFTDEIFALLISTIFIWDSLKDIGSLFVDAIDESEEEVKTEKMASALLSVILCAGVVFISSSLRSLRATPFLHPRFREFISDFSSFLSIALMTGLDAWIETTGVSAQKLPVPRVFEPSLCSSGPQYDAIYRATSEKNKPDTFAISSLECDSKRSWLIDLATTPTWVIFASALPALLATLLLFIDHNISQRLINRADNKLKKPVGYHADLAVMGLLVGVCSLLGLPWLVAATVRSVNHLHALSIVEEWTDNDGKQHEHIIAVKEQRVTAFVIGLLIGLSLLLLNVLRIIPLAVLIGLFLYMGLVALRGSQFFDRMKLLVTETSLFPPTHYARRVPPLTIHTYTGIQILCLVVLMVAKLTPAAIFFPLIIGLLIPLRLFGLPRIFAEAHLEVLDAEEEVDEDEVLDKDAM